ncbi:MAG: nuclease-related domain-containing protein [Candidatus Kryptoniota bacterium]
MSIWRRLVRALDALSNIEQDEVSTYGAEGEEQALGFLVEEGYYSFFNRIVPHPQKRGAFLETDAIIYGEGNVFCVEIKRLKGRIYFPPKSKVVRVKKRFLFWDYETEETVSDGYDTSRIVKAKDGNYGEGVFYKEFANPLGKTRYYIHHLKQFLTRIDQRFSRLFIIPVVGFSDTESDISAIHSLEEGLVYISEIPEFIRRHRDERFANSPSQWIVDGLRQVPTWDRILTRKNEWIQGIILDNAFSCISPDGRVYSIPYSEVECIYITRQDAFSDHDDVRILRVGGQTEVLMSSKGQVNMDKAGEHQIHKLRNINQIRIGTHALR